jgi:outer membrane protein OmpA-like peptidoglycan-associated protein
MVLIAGAALATGCNEREKAEIAALRDQKDRLQMQNKAYRDEISELQTMNSNLQADLQARDAELLAKQQRIAELEEPATQPAQDTGTEAGWQRTTIGDKVTVGSDVLFSSGKASLTAAGKRTLDRIATALRGRYAGMPVRVYGYTDSDPIVKSKKFWADNLDLSANRAMAVTRYLREKGIPAEDIETIAMGATHFVAGNSSTSGKSQNRRVEIFAVRSGSSLPPSP